MNNQRNNKHQALSLIFQYLSSGQKAKLSKIAKSTKNNRN